MNDRIEALVWENRSLVQHPGHVQARVRSSTIRHDRPVLRGHVVPAADFAPPYVIGLGVAGRMFEIGRVSAPAVDGRIEFEVEGPDVWPPPLPQDGEPSLVLVSASGQWVPMPLAAGQSPPAFDYRDTKACARQVTNPATRPKDLETLNFHARRFFEANPDRPTIQAATLTVLCYRVLDKTWQQEDAATYCLTQARPVLEKLVAERADLPFRWSISLALACHYLHLSLGERTAAIPLLRQVHARRDLVVISPPQATNVLKATFHLGVALWNSGEQAEAEAVLLSAKSTFALAAPLWRFDNYWSPGELVDSARLTKACLVWLERAHHAMSGKWRDWSFADAPQDNSEYACLGFPAYEFLRRGLI
jgi:hypothetical protein